MPRHFLKKLVPSPVKLRERWFLRLFGDRIADPRLWTLHRRGVTAAFGAGLAICFIPLPVHMILAGVVSIGWRLNIPVIYATIFVVNPLTIVPVYYAAYRIGAILMGVSAHSFAFRIGWNWMESGLAPFWKPLLLGCATCALVAGLGGWLALELLWRWRVTSRYRARRVISAA